MKIVANRIENPVANVFYLALRGACLRIAYVRGRSALRLPSHAPPPLRDASAAAE